MLLGDKLIDGIKAIIDKEYGEVQKLGYTAPDCFVLAEKIRDYVIEKDCRTYCAEIEKATIDAVSCATQAIKPELLHILYLEATQYINKDSFNSEAKKKYCELTDSQKFIDIFIAGALKLKIIEYTNEFLNSLKDGDK